MSTSIFDTTIPSLTSGLGTLLGLLEKAEAHAKQHDLQPADLLEARLSPDMYTFAEQVQTASDTARRGVQRLCGEEPESTEDPKPTFEALQECVKGALSVVAKADRDRIDASADKAMTISFGPGVTLEYTGRSYMLSFLLPNSMFHVSIAYAILRAKGVELGKIDLLRPFVQEFKVKML